MAPNDRNDRNRNQQRPTGNQKQGTSGNRPWNVLYPRNYTDREGNPQTEFIRIGIAWPLKDKPGYRLEALGMTVIIMPQSDKREPGDDR